MDFLKIAWHYAIIAWPYAIMLGGTCAGLFFGVKMGYKWGEADAKQWTIIKIRAAIEARLSCPFSFLNDPKWDGKKEKRVQGVLELNYPGLEEAKLGLPVAFKFKPNKIKQNPGNT